ncbi:MAG: glycoside hydrolase family 26 protein [Candidatus Azobacteroides sp.]|nr:glycoside hydrolase family 26 protein [Candidatus Azobacteroides sp.]
MKTIKKNFLLILIAAFLFGCHKQGDESLSLFHPSDESATKETIALYSKLKSVMDKGIMLGHQNALAYGNAWYGEKGRSDVKSVCGDYPAIFEWNTGNIETDSTLNVDSISFHEIQSYILEVNQLGGISSLSWFLNNPVTDGNHNDHSVSNPISSIFAEKEIYNKYIASLDKLASFLDSLKDEKGDHIPVLLRLFNADNIMEQYWWNTETDEEENLKKLWKTSVEYLRNEKGLHHILYVYSIPPKQNKESLLTHYPGNEYVDIIGTDIYMDMENDNNGYSYKNDLDISLAFITNFARENNKVPAITGTGLEGIKISNYFTNLLYPVISKYKISYVLFGKNAWNKEDHYFIPIPGHPASEDFMGFVSNPDILTCSNLN